MTTPNEDLIARLRDRAMFLGPELTLAILPEAADLLQSQAERIATLEGDVEYLQEDIDAMCNAIPDYRWSGGAAELIAECFAERDTLRAQLAEIEKTEPVAWINLAASSKMFRFLAPTEEDGTVVKDWQPLFTRPMPAESKDAERYRWLRDYLISPSTHFDDLIVSADKADTLNGVIDAAIAKGAK